MTSGTLSEAFLVSLLTATVLVSAPILLAALGEIFSERAGVLNLGLDGVMLAGALGGFLGSYYAGNVWLGVAAAPLAGVFLALVHGFVSISLRGDQVVSGIMINLLALGLSSFIFRALFGISGMLPVAPGLRDVPVPLLSAIPGLGSILFRHNLLVYFGFLLVPIAAVVLFHTGLGLKIRAVGEHPLAADTMGINVPAVRYACTVLGGVLGGLAGALLSLGLLNVFQDGITGGRGFIALAAVIVGKWNPYGALAAALVFSLAEAAQLRLQVVRPGIPYQLLLVLPYVITMAAMLWSRGRCEAPAALGRPYRRQEGGIA